MKLVKGVIRNCDLFAHKVGLRFGDEPDYESLTGGLLSIIMMVVFVVIFANATLSTINKVYIDSKIILREKTHPPSFEIGVNEFMFAVGFSDIDMNRGERLFDLEMEFRSYAPGARNKTKVNLVPCEREQWAAVGE